MPRTRRRRLWLLIAAGVLGAAGLFAWYHLFREETPYFADEGEHFKYGSVGVEGESGVPYWVWRVLPRVFPDKAGGVTDYRKFYASFGFLWEDGRDTPIGLPESTVGFRRVGLNCGLCHVGSYRVRPDAAPKLVLGAPNTRVDPQRYFRFLFDCASDPRFTADNILREIDAVHDLPLGERLVYRFLVIPAMKRALLEQKRQLAWMDTVPDWGPGRVDPFNPAKVQILKRPYDGTIGNSDMPPLWNWRARRDFALHLDGLNTSQDEVFLNSAIGNGASNATIKIDNLKRMQKWVQDLQPAPYPFPVDAALAARGEALFAAQCSTCHSFGGDKIGTPIPHHRIGTDRHRLDSWHEEASQAFNALDEYDWRYSHFRKTTGYVAVALDGIWTRAPYLHNGSVPTLWDMLTPPEARPTRFYRGYDLFDPKRVGFVSDEAADGKARLFDTRERGNGNQGHRFGTDLSDEEKWALVEFMKSL